ncbi:unnamed protein product [Adineta ricciae]|uniref:DNA damage-binding protein 1 n=1 Tax=Adineta ricciae TaxID=249248 RepID=A0A813NL13_ADIRI|nr:unnamed protein product [Adineta ricciae]CAF1488146.1 unnamed protein product [Adineta ricciae]
MNPSNYVVTVQKPTEVTALATGYFTSSTQLNLIIAKNTHFEIYIIDSEGLKLVKDVSIYGKIIILKCFRLSNMNKDVLFIVTEKCHGMILDCQKTDHEPFDIITKYHGLLEDTGKESTQAPSCTIDTKHGLILCRTTEGVIKVIFVKDLAFNESSSRTFESCNIRIDEQNIVDIQFLIDSPRPTFLVLHSTKSEYYFLNGNQPEEYYLQTYEIELKEREIKRLAWTKKLTLSKASFLIPITHNSFTCLVIGRNSIEIHRQNEPKVGLKSSLLQETTSIIGYCSIDDNYRYLLTDDCGKLYLLILEYENSLKTYDMKLNLLGQVSISRNLTYLDNSVVFIGSHFGDSQLIRLLSEQQQQQGGNYFEILESYTNVGPILDMCFVDFDRQNRQLVTCSGYGKDATLRFIRTGIGIHEHAVIDLPNIKGIWPLRLNNQYDTHLVVAFFDQTRLFYLQNEEIEEVELAAFDLQHQTLFCANGASNQYLQITTHSIRLIGNHGQDLLTEWKSESNEITVASANTTQCVCACGNQLFYFEIGPNSLKQISQCQLPYNVACLDVAPLNVQEERTDLCAVGLWTQISIWICRLPTLDVLHRESLVSDTLPRSVIMITFDSRPYVFISLADGPIIYYSLDREQGLLYDRKKVSLGTKPTTLTICQQPASSSASSQSSDAVLFACSDHPSVISTVNDKLTFSSVNLREIVCMCSFNSEYYGASLILVTDTGVILGRIDDIQKLHKRTLRLGESVRRITFVDKEKVYAVLTQSRHECLADGVLPVSKQAHQKIDCTTKIKAIKDMAAERNESDNSSSIVILDQQTHEARISVKLLCGEEAISICTMNFVDDSTSSYIAVGTTIVFEYDNDRQPIGRLILFSYRSNQLTILTEKELNNAPHQILPFQGKLLVAIGNSIQLFEYSPQQSEFIQLSKPYVGRFKCSEVKVKDDFILFSDEIYSITVLRYNPSGHTFEEIATNASPQLTTACQFIDDDTFVCTETYGNLLCYHKNNESTKELDRNPLTRLGQYHLAEQINIFRHGHLVTQQTSESIISLATCSLMGATSGYIGLVVQLPHSLYRLLTSLEKSLAQHIPSVGQIEHSTWRSMRSDKQSTISSGFIDGDLIQLYLDLPKAVQTELLEHLPNDNQSNVSVEELVKIVEELSRIH